MNKVQEALQSAIDAINEARNQIKELCDVHNTPYPITSLVRYNQAIKGCKSALAEIEKCEPVGEVSGVSVNWYDAAPEYETSTYTKGNVSMNKVLDVCCGSKMFWFDKNNQSVLFGDIREENHILCDGRSLEIKPDMKIDFTRLPFADKTYSLVVFDPPHLKVLGANSWMAKKYGILNNTWQDDIRKGFSECLRVLKPDGVLIFKWNETDIKTTEILKLCKEKPLFGHISGKRSNTHWITFMKSAEPQIASGGDRTTGGWIGQP